MPTPDSGWRVMNQPVHPGRHLGECRVVGGGVEFLPRDDHGLFGDVVIVGAGERHLVVGGRNGGHLVRPPQLRRDADSPGAASVARPRGSARAALSWFAAIASAIATRWPRAR